MALSTGAGFSHFAQIETQIRSTLALIEEAPLPPKHQPFVSKKKEARRRRAELLELQNTAVDQIAFVTPAVEQASERDAKLSELEQEMRRALGLDKDTPTEPAPSKSPAVTAKASNKRIPRSPKDLTPPPAPVRQEPPRASFKRQVEVMLNVRRRDGSTIPFYHADTCVSTLEAELNASKKARGYGLTVLETIEVTVKEYVCAQ